MIKLRKDEIENIIESNNKIEVYNKLAGEYLIKEDMDRDYRNTLVFVHYMNTWLGDANSPYILGN